MRCLLLSVGLFAVLPVMLLGQSNLLKSGPMTGYSEMREVAIWLQTTRAAQVHARYWNEGQPERYYHTSSVNTCRDKAFTATIIADSLEPGLTYVYQLYIDGQAVEMPYPTTFQTQPIWKWRTDPPEFSFLFGSGAYINDSTYDRPGKPYGGGYGIYEKMADRKADFMLWMGDNVYLRQQEWNTKTGLVYRYSHDRSIPELQRFLSATHHYAIWDDHDYGPNDSDRGFWNKNMALEVFEMFWANPSYGVGHIEGAITSFQWGDADFFLLDNRSYRAPNWLDGEDKTQLGEEQIQWLFDNLVKSYATFKFVVMGGQFLSNSGVYEAYTNYGFANERQRIIDFIHKENIRNVVFLSGDVHFSEVSVLREEAKPTIWDLTSSPMNSGVNTNATSQNNTLRIPESVIMERNFAEVTLSGPKDQRNLTIVYFNTSGEKIWEYTFDTENR